MRLIRRPQFPIDAAGSSALQRRERGQGLVEFALVLTPLMFIFLAIMQFGFIFNSYVTLTNASREGARVGTIYAYDRTLSKDQNDTARNNSIRTAILQSLNLLSKTAPNFTSSTTWTKSGLIWTTGDLVVTYDIPTGIVDTDARAGERVTVAATYHQNLFIPLIGNLLPKDSGGRLRMTGETTMVLN